MREEKRERPWGIDPLAEIFIIRVEVRSHEDQERHTILWKQKIDAVNIVKG